MKRSKRKKSYNGLNAVLTTASRLSDARWPDLKGFAPMPPAPSHLEMRLPSGEVARCIGESATQEAPGEAPEAQRHVGKIVPKSPQHGSQNRSKIGPKRLQNGSLEASGRLLGSLGHPGGPKTDF